jgi:hypothetical protein
MGTDQEGRPQKMGWLRTMAKNVRLRMSSKCTSNARHGQMKNWLFPKKSCGHFSDSCRKTAGYREMPLQ